MHKSLEEQLERVFVLKGYRSHDLKMVLITPQPVKAVIAQNAWSYAVKYTAKSLEEPDHEAALKLLLERHPSWTVIPSMLIQVDVHLTDAEKDVPES